MKAAALILAGGQAIRMGGGDKPLLRVGGVPMLTRIIAALRADVADIALSANGDAARFAKFDLPVLADGVFRGEGPLAGVLAGLDWAAALAADALLTVPGDAPFIPVGLATTLAPPPACITSGGRMHPLTALWPTGCREPLRDLLSRPGPRAIRSFATRIGMRQVEVPAGDRDLFLNVNTADDLALAHNLAKRMEEAEI